MMGTLAVCEAEVIAVNLQIDVPPIWGRHREVIAVRLNAETVAELIPHEAAAAEGEDLRPDEPMTQRNDFLLQSELLLLRRPQAFRQRRQLRLTLL